MICVVDNNHHLKPYTFNDEYTILSNEDAIVDAFLTFLDWAISFIQDIVDMVFGPIVDAISNLVDSYCSGVVSALKRAEMDVTATGSVSSSSLTILAEALQGDLYWVLVGLAAIIGLVLLAITPITIGFSFLISIAISLIVAVVVQQALNVDDTEKWDGELATEITDDGVISAMLNVGSGPVDSEMYKAWAMFSVTASIFSISIGLRALCVAKNKALIGLSLATGAISVILGFSSVIYENELMGLGAMFAAISSIISTAADFLNSKTILGSIAVLVGLIGIACGAKGARWI